VICFQQQGYEPRGVVHVGVHKGEELDWYVNMGYTPILGFEANQGVAAETYEKFSPKYSESVFTLVPIALSDYNGDLDLRVPLLGEGTLDTQCGTGLPYAVVDDDPTWGETKMGQNQRVPCRRFEDWARETYCDLSLYDLLVVDVQGMELQVLGGFGDCLNGFSYLNIECSEKPLYVGGAPAVEIVDYLAQRGFRRLSPIERHYDIFFVREMSS
jgi:FkbM family methyltransferase